MASTILLDAVAHLRVIRPDLPVEVELVGDGEARRGLERRAEDLGIATRVRFHGYQEPETFVPLLAATHLCVSPDPPTPFNDVSTMAKVVDYLAIGRPVVAFALTETIGIVGDAGSIVDVPTGEALATELAALSRRPRSPRRRDGSRRSADRRPRSALGSLGGATARGLRLTPGENGCRRGSLISPVTHLQDRVPHRAQRRGIEQPATVDDQWPGRGRPCRPRQLTEFRPLGGDDDRIRPGDGQSRVIDDLECGKACGGIRARRRIVTADGGAVRHESFGQPDRRANHGCRRCQP